METQDDFMNPAPCGSTNLQPVEKIAACGTDGQTTTPERFQITDMQGVSWYLKKLLEKDTQAAALRAELETVTANYQAMLESIEADKRGLEFLYAAQVREVAREEAERLHRKSVTTPYGVLAFREQPGALQLKDRQTCADIALTLGMTTTSADVSAYRKHAEKVFNETGEVLPGMEFKPGEEKFSIRQSKAKAKGDTTKDPDE